MCTYQYTLVLTHSRGDGCLLLGLQIHRELCGCFLLCMYVHGVNQLRRSSRKVGLLGHGRGHPLLSSVRRR